MKKRLENLTRLLIAIAIVITNFSFIPSVFAAPLEPPKGTIDNPVNSRDNADIAFKKTVSTNLTDVKNGIFLVTLEVLTLDTTKAIEDTLTKYFDYYESVSGTGTVTKNSNGTTTVKFSDINKSGYSKVSFKIKINEENVSNNKKWYPTNDEAKVTYQAIGIHSLSIKTTSQIFWKPTQATQYSSYTVKYILQGTDNVIDSETVDNVEVGTSVTKTPKTIAGYNPVSTESVTKTISNIVEENVINFYYTKRTDIPYTIQYRYIENNEEKKVPGLNDFDGTGTFKDSFNVDAPSADGFKLADGEESSKQMQLNNADSNVLTFYYAKRNDLKYNVEYYNETNQNNSEKIKTDEFNNQTYNDEILLSTINLNKFKTFGYQDGVIVFPTDTDKITIGTRENIIKVCYYKRTDIPYKVQYRYIENNEEKKVPGLDDVDGTGTYLEEVTLNAATAPKGFVFAGDNNSIKLTLDEENKTVTFYYAKKKVSYIVEYYLDGELDSSKTETINNIEIGTEINSYTDKLPEGYILDEEKTTKLPFTIQDSDNNVIKVYYESIPQGDLDEPGEIEAPKTGITESYLSFGYIIALGTFLVIRKEQEN